MRRHLRGIICLFALLLLPAGLQAQKPMDENQQKQIGITAQQARELDALFAAADQQRRAVHERLHALYHELHGLYDAYDFDTQRAAALRDEITAQHKRMLALYAENEAKLRRILNRDQFQRLRARMKAEREKRRRESVANWKGPGPPPGPRPDRHP